MTTHIQLTMSQEAQGKLEGQQDNEEDKKECLLKWSSSAATDEELGDQTDQGTYPRSHSQEEGSLDLTLVLCGLKSQSQ